MGAPKQDVLIKAKESWKLLLELNERFAFEISKMLKEAYPNRNKLHVLCATIVKEGVTFTEDEVKSRILAFYKIPFERRTSGQFQRTFGIKSYPWLLSQFVLNFSTAQVSDTKMASLARMLNYYFKMHFDPPREISSTDHLHLVLYKMLTATGRRKHAYDIKEFLAAWEQVTHQKWGSLFEKFFAEMFEQIEDVELASPLGRLPVSRGTLQDDHSGPDLELTQTELDWLASVLADLNQSGIPRPFPLKAGPSAKIVRQVESLSRALNRPIQADLKEKIVNAIISMCETCLDIYGRNNGS